MMDDSIAHRYILVVTRDYNKLFPLSLTLKVSIFIRIITSSIICVLSMNIIKGCVHIYI